MWVRERERGAVGARVEDLVVAGDARGHVVGVEDGRLGRLPEALRAHHHAVHPADREDRGGAPRRGGDDAKAGPVVRRDDGVVGHERLEVRRHADGADARAAAAVRDAERLV